MGERTCSRDDCDRPHYGLDYCRVHYRRLKKSGTTDLIPRQDKGCKADGCPDKHYSLGWCNLHYNRQFRTGSTDRHATCARTYECRGCEGTFDRDPEKLGGSPPVWCPRCKQLARAAAREKWAAANRGDRRVAYTCRRCGCYFCNIVPDGRYRVLCGACKPKPRSPGPEVYRCRICRGVFTYRRTHGLPRQVCSAEHCQRTASSDRSARWAAANRDRCRAASKRYSVANKDKASAYYRENRGRLLAQGKAWREAHPERKRAADRQWAKANPGRRLDAEYRRRARKRNQGYERVYRSVVFARDQWTCQLCQEAVDPSLRGRHPMRASLDHRIALSRGGSHTYSNVQLAHLICNMRKHAN